MLWGCPGCLRCRPFRRYPVTAGRGLGCLEGWLPAFQGQGVPDTLESCWEASGQGEGSKPPGWASWLETLLYGLLRALYALRASESPFGKSVREQTLSFGVNEAVEHEADHGHSDHGLGD